MSKPTTWGYWIDRLYNAAYHFDGPNKALGEKIRAEIRTLKRHRHTKALVTARAKPVGSLFAVRGSFEDAALEYAINIKRKDALGLAKNWIKALHALPHPPVASRSVEQAIGTALRQSAGGSFRFGVNECQKQNRLVYGIPTDGTRSASAWWAKCPSSRKVPTTKPASAPRGALHYFTGGSQGSGHVMISLGGSHSLSTDIHRIGYFDQTSVEEVLARWPSLHYVGWCTMTDGVLLPLDPRKGQ